ncbi:MAG: hypothetical protein NZM18_03695 [Thermoflexales bacterium]|nr:hypothetical protein [Thermoflexales bacterium]
MHAIVRLAIVCFAAIVVIAHGTTFATAQMPAFSGLWRSTGCEAWPGRPFAYRELTISGTTYRLDVTSFADDKCSIPTLRTRYEGQFVARNPSATIPGAWDVEFVIQRTLLTPYILNTADFLNSAPRGTCGNERWFVGIEQDLAATGGCSLIGLNLRGRPVEYDIGVVQANQLLLGRRPADGGLLSAPERRPTDFGPPLLRAGDASPVVVPDEDNILLPPVGGDQTSAAILIATGVALMVAGQCVRRRIAVRPRSPASPTATAP